MRLGVLGTNTAKMMIHTATPDQRTSSTSPAHGTPCSHTPMAAAISTW